MTSTEYDRIRLEALPAAVKILDKIRWDLCTDNRPAWNLLYDAAEHTKKQNAAEWKAYFTPQPDPPPAPPSDLLSFQAGYLQNIVKERADAIRIQIPTDGLTDGLCAFRLMLSRFVGHTPKRI